MITCSTNKQIQATKPATIPKGDALRTAKKRLLAFKQEQKEDTLILHEIINLKFESQEMQLNNLLNLCGASLKSSSQSQSQALPLNQVLSARYQKGFEVN